MYKEKIVSFYCSDDCFSKMHRVSFTPDTSSRIIEEILSSDFGGEIKIIGYEYY